MKKRIVHAAAVLAAGAVAASATDARAQAMMNCADYPHPVYVGGSTAVQPVFRQIAAALGSGISLIYQGPGSCAGITDVATAGMKETSTAVYLPLEGAAATPVACAIPAGGTTLDIGISDVYPATCNVTVGAGLKEYLGPIQVMSMVAPLASTESSISADAAYMVFGFAGQAPNQVAPWVDPTQMFIRASNSGTLNMIGSAIGLAATKWMPGDAYAGQRKSSSGDVLNGVQGATNASAAIGILAADFADAHRDVIKTLAYQHTGQECGYLPDSDATHFDKINVRQGRYAIWGAAHFVTHVDATGTPLSADAATVLNYFTGAGLDVTQKQTMIQVEANAFTIPLCAMQVTRSSEIGAEASFEPDEPCGCYYESLKGTPISACTMCPNGNGDCVAPTPVCRYGYCEAQ